MKRQTMLSKVQNMNTWASTEGSSFPLGVKWIEEEQAYNFALYSKHAQSVKLLLYGQDNIIHPLFAYDLNFLKNKSGRICHCRIPKKAISNARYYAYVITGSKPATRFEWHCFDPDKILLDPYAQSIFFPPDFDRNAAEQSGSNAGKAPVAFLCACEQSFD